MKRILHHTAVSREDQPSQFYAVNRYHRYKNWGTAKKPWHQTTPTKFGYWHGYTHFMGTNGVVTQTRGLDEEGLHTIGHNNEGAIALCIAMDGNREIFNEKQIAGFKKFDKENPGDPWKFHRDLTKNRTCPGKLITREWFNNSLIKSSNGGSDLVDIEKRKEIQRLSNILDQLREIVLMLVSLMKIKSKK